MRIHYGKLGGAAALLGGLGLGGVSYAQANAGNTAAAPTQAPTGEGAGANVGAGANAGGTGAGMGASPGGGAGAAGANYAGGTVSPMAAPVPQYWLADASLFIGNAGNAAATLAVEGTLNIQAPQVLGNQAEFMLAAANRALSSMLALQQNAEATNPAAVPAIRAVVGQLVAAQAEANQAYETSANGLLGPTYETTVRSALAHLEGAERDMLAVGRAYGSPAFSEAGICKGGRSIGAARGAGIGGARR